MSIIYDKIWWNVYLDRFPTYLFEFVKKRGVACRNAENYKTNKQNNSIRRCESRTTRLVYLYDGRR